MRARLWNDEDRLHPEAYEEMIESARFYEERDDGLGMRFLEAVEDTTRRIRQFPYAGSGRKSRHSKGVCLWLSIHGPLPGSEGSNLRRSRNASAQKAWLLEEAIAQVNL